MKAITMSPVRSHLALKPGVSEVSPGYAVVRRTIEAVHRACLEGYLRDTTLELRRARSYERLYGDLSEDSGHPEMFTLTARVEGAVVHAHVHSNSISVVELELERDGSAWEDSARGLEAWAQQRTDDLVPRFYDGILYPFLERVSREDSSGLLEPIGGFSAFRDMNAESAGAPILWTARMVVLEPAELAARRSFVEKWLEHTLRPADAEEILNGASRYSVRWLNYAIVDSDEEQTGYVRDAILLAQYFYAAQEACIKNLQQILSTTFLRRDTQNADIHLQAIRSTAELHVAGYFEARKFLQRQKKAIMEEILRGWEFAESMDNTRRLAAICSRRISDLQARRQQRNTVITDLILGAIGFVTLFDLALGLSQYGREIVMGFPDRSFIGILVRIGQLPTDSILIASFGVMVALFLLYAYFKRR